MSSFWGTGGLLSKVSGFISSVDVKIKTPSSAENDAVIPGGSLVARHEKNWDIICSNSVALASKVQAEDARMKLVSQRCEAELSSWTHLGKELDALTEVGNAVELLRAQMEEMCCELQLLDAALDGHIQLREEKEIRKWHEGVERDTANFASARERDLQVLEKTLKADMAKKARARQQEQAAAAAAAAGAAAAGAAAAGAAAAAAKEASAATTSQGGGGEETKSAAKEASAATTSQGGGGEETKQGEPEAKEAVAPTPVKGEIEEKEDSAVTDTAPGEGQAESEGGKGEDAGKDGEFGEGAKEDVAAADEEAAPETASPEEEKQGYE